MNSVAVFLLVSSLVVCAFGQQLDLSCSGLCNLNCNLVDTSCRLLPGLTQLCDTIQATCSGVCDTTCTCLDGCNARCAGDFTECVQGGNPIVDGTLCLATQSLCGVLCFPSCGVRLGGGVLNQVISTIG